MSAAIQDPSKLLEPLQVLALREALASTLDGFELVLAREVDSTNTQLLQRARAGQTQPCLMAAERQTAGRGRLGKTWAAAPGDSLTFSLGLALAPADWSGLSLVVGTALAEALHPRVRLKWPNDLWVLQGSSEGLMRNRVAAGAARKLAGILIETASIDGPALAAKGVGGACAARYCVVGVGINLALPPPLTAGGPAFGAPMAAVPPAALREWAPAVQVGDVLCQVAVPIVKAILSFQRHGFAPWQARFADRDALFGQEVVLSDGRCGTAQGVDACGALIVHTDAGRVLVSSAEVSVRPRNLAV